MDVREANVSSTAETIGCSRSPQSPYAHSLDASRSAVPIGRSVFNNVRRGKQSRRNDRPDSQRKRPTSGVRTHPASFSVHAHIHSLGGSGIHYTIHTSASTVNNTRVHKKRRPRCRDTSLPQIVVTVMKRVSRQQRGRPSRMSPHTSMYKVGERDGPL